MLNTMLPSLNLQTLITDAKKVVENSPTTYRLKHNMRIFEKLLKAVDESEDVEDFILKAINDYELFCVVFVRPDNDLPMFPAPWQVEATRLVEEKDEVWVISSRKVGKTAWLTSLALYLMAKYHGTSANTFAPTEYQLFVMKDILKAISRNPFLKHYFVIGVGGQKYKLGLEEVTFTRTNSYIQATTLNIREGGDTKRGMKGNLIIVDEASLLTPDIFKVILHPATATAYYSVKLVITGTIDTKYNPEFPDEVDEAKKDPAVGFVSVGVWRGLYEGCITPRHVKKTFKKYKIDCKPVLETGFCPKKFKLEGYENYECDMACMANPDFVREYLAKRVEDTGVPFPRKFLERAMEDYQLSLDPGGDFYVMGIDFGLVDKPTQIVVMKIIYGDPPKLKLYYWEQIEPNKVMQTGEVSYDFAIRRIKYIYRMFRGSIKKIYADATGVGMNILPYLTKPPDPIPPAVFYTNDTAARRGLIGIVSSGIYNSVVKDNYQKQLLAGNIIVPNIEPFRSLFLKEHTTVIRRESNTFPKYSVWNCPKGGTMDLLDALSYAAIYLMDTTSAAVKPVSDIAVVTPKDVRKWQEIY